MNKSARRTPFVLAIVVTALLFVISMTGTILFAALSVNQSKTVTNVGVVGTLSATISANTIAVNNDMDCVLRVSPLSTGITFASAQWFLQDNGWYYYYKVIGKADTNKTITLTGATTTNIAVELAQAQYLVESSTGITKAGFITEWASRDINSNISEFLGEYTSDGLQVTYGNQSNAAIVMYSGHDQTRRIPSSSYTTEEPNRFKATKTGDHYVFNKINLTSGTNFESITDSNAITIYNNTDITVIYMIQVIDGGTQPGKNSVFSNGNWTTYLDTTPNASSRFFVKAESSSATDGYSTYFVSRSVAPGEYVDLTNGTDNKLYFSNLPEDTPIRLSVTSVDTMTFYNSYVDTPTGDKYLAWLKSLDENKSGATFYTDFTKILKQ